MHDKVDVLIIGSGASGAAVAWSLAETRMRILCLEQGDWVKPTDYPSNGRDWEARLFSDFAINPNRRARPTDYPINDANSPIKVVNFNGVGGSTIMSPRIFRACTRRTSRCARSTASPTTGRSTTRPWSRSSPRTTG
jgi:choline dehydrogenase-like flavoprotein